MTLFWGKVFAVLKRLWTPETCFLLLAVGGVALSIGLITPPGAVISGIVQDDAGPVAWAVVRVRASSHYTQTGADGRFVLTGIKRGARVEVTAWAPGYYIGGTNALIAPDNERDAPVIITLHHHPTEDNPDYEFISPVLDKDTNPGACAHCHAEREPVDFTLPVEEWLQDAHSGSAVNPRFLSLYNGTTIHGDPGQPTRTLYNSALMIDIPLAPSLGMDGVGPGFRLDFPDIGGPCATCHAPIVALQNPVYAADPNTAQGVAAEGITCDFCHKIQDVILRSDGLPSASLPGVLSMVFLRPPEGEQVFFGQLDDVSGEDIFLPLANESAFCAPCHIGDFWGVRMYNSYGEWLESPYSDPETGQTCQDCHMPHTHATAFVQLPPDSGMLTPPPRDPQTIFSHLMPGAADVALLQDTAKVQIEAARVGETLHVTVHVTNTGAGHHVPTDSPLRNMILRVKVTGDGCTPLSLIEGPVIPEWGGVGDHAEGYYAGQPGVLYAKVLADFYTGETPTYAYWRQTEIVSDNRLPALATDTTTYTFALPQHGGAVTVEAQLWLRRAFIELMDAKQWDTPDILMEHETVVVE